MNILHFVPDLISQLLHIQTVFFIVYQIIHVSICHSFSPIKEGIVLKRLLDLAYFLLSTISQKLYF